MAERQTFPRSHRLSGKLQFARVFEARRRASRGPLMVYAAPNGLEHSRLGLSVSGRVGVATRRTRIKRMLREAYRLARSELPGGYDWVVVVRPHEPATLEAYCRWLRQAVEMLDRQWKEQP